MISKETGEPKIKSSIYFKNGIFNSDKSNMWFLDEFYIWKDLSPEQKDNFIKSELEKDK